MPIKPERKYLLLIFYICLTVTGVFISYNIVFNIKIILSSLLSVLSTIIDVLEPLIIGVCIAYLLFPLTDALNKLLARKFKMKRNYYFISVLTTYLSVLFLFILSIVGIHILIGGRISDNNNLSTMFSAIKEYIEKYNDLFKDVNSKIAGSGLSGDLKSYLNGAIVYTSTYIRGSINSIFEFTQSFGSTVINSYIGLFISFYLLKDYEMLKRNYHKMMLLFFAQGRVQAFNKTATEINTVVSTFIRGQVLDGLIVGLVSSIGLMMIGMDFAFLIGFAAGVANIIPYIGPIVGCIPAIVVGLLSQDPMQAIWAVLVFFIVQQLDEAIISPKIVGDSTGIHPVLIIMAVIIGASLGGIMGMLLAVPTMGVIKLFVVKFIEKRTKAKLWEEPRDF